MGENPTISVHSAKAVTAGAGDPAKQCIDAGVKSSSPSEVAAIEVREESNLPVYGDTRGESPIEEARDEPAAEDVSAPLDSRWVLLVTR